MIEKIYYRMIFYNGTRTKELVVDKDNYCNYELIEPDKIQVKSENGCYEGLIWRVSENKHELEEEMKTKPIDIPRLIKNRFTPFPSIYGSKAITRNDDRFEVKTNKEITRIPQGITIVTAAQIHEKPSKDKSVLSSKDKSMLSSKDKPKTTEKRKLKSIDKTSLITKDITEKSRKTKTNTIEELAKEDPKIQNIIDDFEDPSNYKKYKVYKRKLPDANYETDKKILDQNPQQETVPSNLHYANKPITEKLSTESRNQATNEIPCLNIEQLVESSIRRTDEETTQNEIEATPENNHEWNSAMKMFEQLECTQLNQPNKYSSSEDDDNEENKVRDCERKYMRLSIRYRELKKMYVQMQSLNASLIQHVDKLSRSHINLLMHNEVLSSSRRPSLPRVLGRSTKLSRSSTFHDDIMKIDSDESISDEDADLYPFMEHSHSFKRKMSQP